MRVRVRPGASRTEVVGFKDGVLTIRIASAPEKGRANQALLSFLAGLLGVGRRSVSVVAGERSRDKLVQVVGLESGEVAARLAIAGRVRGGFPA